MTENDLKETERPGSEETPISEIEPRLRLGTLLMRYRVRAGVGAEELAKHLQAPLVAYAEVERGMASLKAEQLQAAAAYLHVRYEPLLEAAREWNRAIFDEQGAGGVELTETTVTERALRGGEQLLERELIRAADDLAFVSNVAREIMVKADRASRRARALLHERGVPIPDAPETEIVECAGPVHDYRGEEKWAPHTMRLGVDYVLSYEEPVREGEDPKPTVYFCSDECAKAYRVVHGLEEPPPDDDATDAT